MLKCPNFEKLLEDFINKIDENLRKYSDSRVEKWSSYSGKHSFFARSSIAAFTLPLKTLTCEQKRDYPSFIELYCGDLFDLWTFQTRHGTLDHVDSQGPRPMDG